MFLYGRKLYERLLNEQYVWITRCGGDLAGYIANYGSRPVEEVKAIYQADQQELQRIKQRLV